MQGMSDSSEQWTPVPSFQFKHRLALGLEVGEIKPAEMADYLKVSLGTVRNWLAGRHRPSNPAIARWALRCGHGTTYDWLVSGAGHGPNSPAASEVPVRGSRCNVPVASAATIHRMATAA